MDARITKSRLANFLAYDWLKILVAVAIAVAALCVFFVTIQTHPRDDQEYQLYCYTGLSGGEDSSKFTDSVKDGDIFSYDILTVGFESFDAFEAYSAAAFAARRAAGQGKAMFVSGTERTVYDEKGEPHTTSVYEDYLLECINEYGTEKEYLHPIFELPEFFHDCETYLAGVFGEDWRTGDINEEVVRSLFLSRNGKDKRFKTATQREEGIALERARLLKLRTDTVKVLDAIDTGVYSYESYTSEIGNTYTVGLNVGRLPKLSGLVYFYKTNEDGTTVRSAENVRFVIFNNNEISTDLKYESVSVLAWMLEAYGA